LETERSLSQRRDRPLPSGFVTLLMTDIEGSTALVHHLGERYGQLLDDLLTILRRSVVQAGGHEIEARADEFFAAFESPRSAVDAAVNVQRELLACSWPDELAVRVRIGIHSGYPTSTETNYIGMDVHAASRICAVGHGGQVVVSANTREGVKASAPNGVRFTSLGSHRLRGLPEAMPLFQVGAIGFAGPVPSFAELTPASSPGSLLPRRLRSGSGLVENVGKFLGGEAVGVGQRRRCSRDLPAEPAEQLVAVADVVEPPAGGRPRDSSRS